MSKTAIAALDHGVWRDGVPARDAELRPVTGVDELTLAEFPATAGMAARVTELLARTVQRIGAEPAPGREMVRALSVGDRERLLLELHALSFGPSCDLVVTCPDPACADLLEIAVSLDDLIQSPIAAPAPEHVAVLNDGEIRFRLPTGADQEDAAAIALSDPEAAAQALLDRCLIGAPRAGRAALRSLLAERLPALDPQAETVVEIACPSCGATTAVLFDAAPLVFARLAGARLLMAEIDQIARAYHWSEAEILALPVHRRRAYLDLIAQATPSP